MDACQLLLGRPWQYDRRVTHEVWSNTYYFWDDGRRRILPPMFDREIKVDTIILQKKKVEKTIPKPRTVLFQGRGDDVAISASYLIPARRKNAKQSVNQTGVEQILSTENIPV